MEKKQRYNEISGQRYGKISVIKLKLIAVQSDFYNTSSKIMIGKS